MINLFRIIIQVGNCFRIVSQFVEMWNIKPHLEIFYKFTKNHIYLCIFKLLCIYISVVLKYPNVHSQGEGLAYCSLRMSWGGDKGFNVQILT